MDPELKARLRGLSPGSREYQAAIDAFNRERAAQRERDARLQQEQEQARADREERRLSAERERSATTEREQRTAREEAERQSAMVTAGATGGGLGAGVTGGYLADRYATPRYRAEMAARSGQISDLARTARSIDPASPAARAAYSDVVAAAERGNLLRRPLPWGTGTMAAGLAGMGAYSTFGRAPESRSDVERALWTGTGYGELGAATKLAAGSINRYRNPGVAYPAADVAAIEGSRRMAEGGELRPLTGSEVDPQASQAAARTARQTELMGSTGDALKTQARGLGLPVSGTKAALTDRILDHEAALARGETPVTRRLPRATKTLLPLLAGGLAYDAATSGAEAADMTPEERRTRGMLAGGVAAGTTAGVPYALEKAGPIMARSLLGRAAMRALPVASTAQLAASDIGPEVQPDIVGLPTLGGELDRYDIDRAQRLQRERMPMTRAAGLEIPENIPVGATANADRRGTLNDALARLLSAIDEHNNSLAPPPGRNPAIQYDLGDSAY